VEAELARLGVEHGHAGNVGRQQVARELDALVGEAERARQCVRERGLADARDVLDEQVPAGEEARERQAQLPFLAENDPASTRSTPTGSSGAAAI
jgi:hypothetical protein